MLVFICFSNCQTHTLKGLALYRALFQEGKKTSLNQPILKHVLRSKFRHDAKEQSHKKITILLEVGHAVRGPSPHQSSHHTIANHQAGSQNSSSCNLSTSFHHHSPQPVPHFSHLQANLQSTTNASTSSTTSEATCANRLGPPRASSHTLTALRTHLRPPPCPQTYRHTGHSLSTLQKTTIPIPFTCPRLEDQEASGACDSTGGT